MVYIHIGENFCDNGCNSVPFRNTFLLIRLKGLAFFIYRLGKLLFFLQIKKKAFPVIQAQYDNGIVTILNCM
jgi:hypothetical protein